MAFQLQDGSKGTGAKRYESPGTPRSTGASAPVASAESAPMPWLTAKTMYI